MEITRNIAEVFIPFISPHRFKVAEGGRGGGKSHFFAEEAVYQVHTFGKKALCCREVQKSIKESVFELVMNKIKEKGLEREFTATLTEIRHRNGGKFSFAGLRQQGTGKSGADNLKSYEGYDICWVEEAQNVSKYSLELLLPTIRKPGSEVWFGYNRKDDNEPVHSFFVDTKTPPADTVHIYVNYWDNPWFPDVLRSLMLATKASDIDDYNHVWLGLPRKRSKEHVFVRWRVAEFAPNEQAKLKHGADWGFDPDPCTIVRTWKDDELRRIYVDYAVYAVGLVAEDIIPRLWNQVPLITGAKVICDNARPEMIQTQRNKSFNAVACQKFPGSVEAGLTYLCGYEIWIHPRCQEMAVERFGKDTDFGLVREFEKYKRKVDPQTGNITCDLIDKFNHGIDALRYAYSEEILANKGVDYVAMMGKSSDVEDRAKRAILQSQGRLPVGQHVPLRELKIPGMRSGVILP